MAGISHCAAKVADTGSGATRMIKMTIGTAATYTSTLFIPAGNEVVSVRVTIATAYSAGATIKVGYTEADDAIVKTTDINPQAENTWTLDQETAWHSDDRQVLVTISDTPADGACIVRVFFSNPNA
jgi:DNA-directed RNA polymerase subunit E'/Rpb7